MNIMKIIIATKPALANFLAYEILSSNAKKEEIAKIPTIGTAADTKTDLFGNSNGEKDDIVKSIKMPEITVASTMIMSLALRFAEGPEEVEWEGEGGDIFVENSISILLMNYNDALESYLSLFWFFDCKASSFVSSFLVDQKVRLLMVLLF